MTDRPLAITDCEMTGLDPRRHEIIEIGLVLAHPRTLDIIDTLDVKVKPEHIETADPDALKINGYNEGDWKDALTLQVALAQYATKTANGIFTAQNVSSDWSFIDAAFEKTQLWNRLDYHRIDTFAIAWAKLRHSGLKEFNLVSIAEFLGVPKEPLPHRAINGAMCAYEIYKKLMLQ